jgi:radical SAM superfamily enzyme YgiQ (UPF0313 family)
MNSYPLNIGYIHASLTSEKYCKVSFLDGEMVGKKHVRDKEQINKDPRHPMWKEISRGILSAKPDLVAFSCYSISMTATKYITDILRKENYRGQIWAGGIHPTNCPVETLENILGLDGVVMGEGEVTVRELCKVLNNNDDSALSEIKGIAYRKKGEIKINDQRPLIKNMDEMPIPTRNFAEAYTYTDHIVLTSRGCPFLCDFCDSKTMWGRRVRYRSTEHVLNEIKSIASLGVRTIGLRDDTFTLNKKHVENICRSIKDMNLNTLSYTVGSRIDTMSDDMIALLKEMNVKMVTFGVETGSPAIQRKIKKNLNIDKVVPVVQKTNQAGIKTITFLMVGHPGETKEDLQHTTALIRKLAKHCKDNLIEINITCPYPGTGYWDYAVKKHGNFIDFYTESYKLYHQARPLVNLTDMESDEFYSYVKKIRRLVDFKNNINHPKLALYKMYLKIRERLL